MRQKGTLMSFLRRRDSLMSAFGWNRRVATLAIRLASGADTWESIASTPSFLGRPLLSVQEAGDILQASRVAKGCANAS